MGYTYKGDTFTEDDEPLTRKPSGPFDWSRCGTYPNYRQHTRYGIPACQACKDASNEYERARYAKRKGGKVREVGAVRCGTYAGYRRHMKDGSAACAGCRTAKAAA